MCVSGDSGAGQESGGVDFRTLGNQTAARVLQDVSLLYTPLVSLNPLSLSLPNTHCIIHTLSAAVVSC